MHLFQKSPNVHRRSKSKIRRWACCSELSKSTIALRFKLLEKRGQVLAKSSIWGLKMLLQINDCRIVYCHSSIVPQTKWGTFGSFQAVSRIVRRKLLMNEILDSTIWLVKVSPLTSQRRKPWIASFSGNIAVKELAQVVLELNRKISCSECHTLWDTGGPPETSGRGYEKCRKNERIHRRDGWCPWALSRWGGKRGFVCDLLLLLNRLFPVHKDSVINEKVWENLDLFFSHSFRQRISMKTILLKTYRLDSIVIFLKVLTGVPNTGFEWSRVSILAEKISQSEFVSRWEI